MRDVWILMKTLFSVAAVAFCGFTAVLMFLLTAFAFAVSYLATVLVVLAAFSVSQETVSASLPFVIAGGAVLGAITAVLLTVVALRMFGKVSGAGRAVIV